MVEIPPDAASVSPALDAALQQEAGAGVDFLLLDIEPDLLSVLSEQPDDKRGKGEGDREPRQGLGDLCPESTHAQPDVEDAADRQPRAAG